MRLSARHARGLAGIAALLACTACALSPGSQRIIGPDGTAMAHVHCGSDQGACFRMAGELCPKGYDLTPVLRGSDGNFLVRCRSSAVVPTLAAACPAPASSASSVAASIPRAAVTSEPTPPTGKDAWPPAAEPSPATYPWPRAETSAAVHQPNAATPNGHETLDIGY